MTAKRRRRSPHRLRLPLLLLEIAGAGVITACATAPPLSPVYRAVGAGAAPDGGVALGHQGLSVRLREIQGGERQQFLVDRGAGPIDPFDLRRNGAPFFRTFLIAIDNQSGGPAYFNPSFITLHLPSERRFPMGYAQLYGYLRAALQDDASRERYAKLVEETSLAIPTGTSVERLLVFRDVPPKVKEVILDLAGIQVQGGVLETRLRFTRVAAR